MTTKHFILATAGHVDHGKSALVKALTGIDPDRLPEEKARGITIELGFAHIELASPNESEIFSIGVIDVPGHEDFVKKMVSGAGAIDLALLAVAADDGWMPQTEEHLQVLIYLGVPKIVVALTKTDLAKQFDTAGKEIRAQLRATPFADAAIVKTSALSAAGLTELREQIAREFASLEPQRDIDKPRLHVDRAFSLRGIGTVVTGTLVGGKLRRGEMVMVQPRAIPTRIRSLQTHNRDMGEIGPATRAALNLADVPVASDTNTEGVRRGDIVTRAGSGEANATIDVSLMRILRSGTAPLPLPHGARVRVHHGTSNVPARIFLQEGDALLPGQAAVAELRLTNPILAFTGDRIVIRDSTERQTLAGAVVLDPSASAKNFRKPAQKEFLRACSVMPLTSSRFVEAQLKRDYAVISSELLRRSCFSAAEILDSLRALASKNEIGLRGELAVDAPWWRAAIAKAVAAVDAEHAAHPEKPGFDLVRLRRLLALKSEQIFDALLADLATEGVIRTGDVVRCASHRTVLPPALQKIAIDIRRVLAANPFDPPSRKDFIQSAEAKQALRFLIQSGEVLEINDEIALLRDSFFQMRDAIVSFIQKNGGATVAELRQRLSSSRRVMVPLLEYLDRNRITRRVGDRRALVG